MIHRRPAGSFAAIASVQPDEFADENGLDAFGLSDRDQIRKLVETAMQTGIVHPGFGGGAIPAIQPPPPGEPDGGLIAFPAMLRHGLACSIIEVEGRNTLDAVSIYFSEGVEHRFTLDSISLSQSRGQGILNGALNDEVAVCLYEPTFVSDRQWHGEGSVHKVVVYGIPHAMTVSVPPPVEVDGRPPGGPGAKIRPSLEGAAMIMPLRRAPRSYYSVRGPVKTTKPYDTEVLGQRVWRTRVTVARTGEYHEDDLDIDLFVPESILGQTGLPAEGDVVRAAIRLCCRIWIANVTA